MRRFEPRTALSCRIHRMGDSFVANESPVSGANMETNQITFRDGCAPYRKPCKNWLPDSDSLVWTAEREPQRFPPSLVWDQQCTCPSGNLAPYFPRLNRGKTLTAWLTRRIASRLYASGLNRISPRCIVLSISQRQEVDMRYDIFKLVNGAPIWTGTANSSHELRGRISLLRDDSVRECVIIDHVTGHRSVVNCNDVRTPESHPKIHHARTPSSFRHP